MEKLTDEIVFEKEQEYRKNRKEIILDGLKKAKLSDSLYKISIKNVIVFGAIFIVGNGLVLANVDVNEVLGKGLAIVGTLSAFGAIGCDAYSGFLEKDVDETIKSLKEKDAVMNYKEEMNSSYMKSIIKMMNPKLFRKLNSSKLSDPVNIVTFSSLDKDEIE